MALTRTETGRGQRSVDRTFGFRAFHGVINRLVNIHSCSFDSLESDALVSLPETPLVVFRAKMKDIVLLEDTSRVDRNGVPIYEGDVCRGQVQNEWGSFQMLEGPVVFDESKWGFVIDFDVSSTFEITGFVQDVEVIGNMFDPLYYEKTLPTQEKEAGPAQ